MLLLVVALPLLLVLSVPVVAAHPRNSVTVNKRAPKAAAFAFAGRDRRRSRSAAAFGAGTDRRRPLSITLAATYKVSTPSQGRAVELGVREWPQQVRRGSWTESLGPNDDAVARYVLSGSVRVEEEGGKSDILDEGSLLEATGPAQLRYRVLTDEAIILTPTYEEGGNYLAALALLVTTTVAAIVAFS